MIFKRRPKLSGGLNNTTPLVDVVFNLLLFFMLSSSMVVHSGIKIKLPEATIKETEKETQLNVTITEKSQIFLNEKSIDLEDLFPAIENVVGGGGTEEILFIKADASVRHGLVVEVMDIAKRAGVGKLAIATQPKK